MAATFIGNNPDWCKQSTLCGDTGLQNFVLNRVSAVPATGFCLAKTVDSAAKVPFNTLAANYHLAMALTRYTISWIPFCELERLVAEGHASAAIASVIAAIQNLVCTVLFPALIPLALLSPHLATEAMEALRMYQTPTSNLKALIDAAPERIGSNDRLSELKEALEAAKADILAREAKGVFPKGTYEGLAAQLEVISDAVPPPPKGPAPTFGMPPAQAGRTDLLAAIRGGKKENNSSAAGTPPPPPLPPKPKPEELIACIEKEITEQQTLKEAAQAELDALSFAELDDASFLEYKELRDGLRDAKAELMTNNNELVNAQRNLKSAQEIVRSIAKQRVIQLGSEIEDLEGAIESFKKDLRAYEGSRLIALYDGLAAKRARKEALEEKLVAFDGEIAQREKRIERIRNPSAAKARPVQPPERKAVDLEALRRRFTEMGIQKA